MTLGLLALVAAASGAVALEPHAAAELWDNNYPTQEACQAALERARETPSSDRLQRLYRQAECRAEETQRDPSYRVRLHWKRRPVVRSGPSSHEGASILDGHPSALALGVSTPGE